MPSRSDQDAVGAAGDAAPTALPGMSLPRAAGTGGRAGTIVPLPKGDHVFKMKHEGMFFRHFATS